MRGLWPYSNRFQQNGACISFGRDAILGLIKQMFTKVKNGTLHAFTGGRKERVAHGGRGLEAYWLELHGKAEYAILDRARWSGVRRRCSGVETWSAS